MKAISFTQKRAEQFVRSDNMGFTVVFERINNPAPPIAREGTAIGRWVSYTLPFRKSVLRPLKPKTEWSAK